MIPFPTRPAGKQGRIVGYPYPAAPCSCPKPMFQVGDDMETCKRCGHLPAAVVDLTFRRQSRALIGREYAVAA
jgi:hypothetical protein